jgi:hypothetical protein
MYLSVCILAYSSISEHYGQKNEPYTTIFNSKYFQPIRCRGNDIVYLDNLCMENVMYTELMLRATGELNVRSTLAPTERVFGTSWQMILLYVKSS